MGIDKTWVQASSAKPIIRASRWAAATALTSVIFVGGASAAPLGTGSFTGATGHTTSGSVTVSEQSGRYVIELGGDFFHDGAPDPYVALGKGSKLINGGLVAVLGANTGKQRYAIKVNPALQGATEILIWCKKYSVPIGVAPIK